MRFPSIKDVAADLRDVSNNTEGECDVRLQVYPDGAWIVRTGDSGYDLDHHGYWGAASVPGTQPKRPFRSKRFNSTDTARELIEQTRDARAEEIECRRACAREARGLN